MRRRNLASITTAAVGNGVAHRRTDPSDRRGIQVGPEEAADRFRSAHATSPIGFALLDETGLILHANPALCRMLDVTEPELLRRPFTDVTNPDDVDLVEEAAADLLCGADGTRVVLRLGSGQRVQRWADVTMQLIRDRTERPYLFTFHVEDQTDHVEVLGHLGHAARVSLAGEMAPGIGHDLRNALTAIGARLEAMAGQNDQDGRVGHDVHGRDHSDLDELVAAVHRAHTLAGQLIDLVHPSPPSRELLDLGALVASVEQIIRSMAGPDVVIEVDTEPAVVTGDPIELERVLLTVVSNALDAIDGHGTVTIAVSRVTTLRPANEHRKVELVVSDTGSGMDEATVAAAFEPYFTTKRTGTGLGLASSRSLVEALGGTISIRSRPGVGTTVTVSLDDAGHDETQEET